MLCPYLPKTSRHTCKEQNLFPLSLKIRVFRLIKKYYMDIQSQININEKEFMFSNRIAFRKSWNIY